MAPPAIKKRKLASPSGDADTTYAQDTAVNLFKGPSDMESEMVQENGNGSIPRRHTTIETGMNTTRIGCRGTHGENILKLKTNELLAKLRPDYERRMVKVENSLRRLKVIIEQIPDREAKPILEAEREQLDSHHIRIPFPQPRPAEDAKYTLAYSKPANINVVGSYASKTAIPVEGRLDIDLAVTMPSHIFQEKDYLNYRYFHKRAYYIACLASGIQEAHGNSYAVDFAHQNDNHLQPIIVLTPLQDGGLKTKHRIRIILAADGDLFPISKTLPSKNCIRPIAGRVSSQDSTSNLPTPFYNASLRSECSTLAYLKHIHTFSLKSHGFSDACRIGTVWLRQRGLSREFGPFEWACTMALLMQGGGTQGEPVLLAGYDSHQLFKATLQYLSLSNIVTTPVFVHFDNISLVNHDAPVLFDGERGHNLLFKLTRGSYSILKHEAGITLKLLDDPLSDRFDACFITKVDDPVQRFDSLMRMRTSQVQRPASQMVDALSDETCFCRRVYEALVKGLSDRVTLINVQMPAILPWVASTPNKATAGPRRIQVGILLDPENIGRTVDRGPPTEDKVAAATFRRFWGDKAELRRFRDGSIRESLIWSTSDPMETVLKQILVFVIGRHLGKDVVDSIELIGESYDRLLPGQNLAINGSSTLFQPVMNSFENLKKELGTLPGLPLQIRQISAADAQLRYSSPRIPALHPPQYQMEPANICIQFEDSGRWPDDIAAVQRTKIAFLLKIGELLEESNSNLTTRLGIENCNQKLLNCAFLDVRYPSGMSFRLRIHHERELSLLERHLKDSSHTAASRVESGSALSTYKRFFIQGPIHTQAVCTLNTRFPLLSPSIRLMKIWRDTHMLSTHISDELIELLTIRTFVHSYPWRVPGSVMTGFLRTLKFLSKWDWQNEPLVVDFNGEMTTSGIEAANLRFEAWRKIDPVMHRVSMFAASNLDSGGITWTEMSPPKVVAARFTGLAKAACGMLKERGPDLEPKALFIASMADYDFVIHLNPRTTVNNNREKEEPKFKNLQFQSDQHKRLAGISPAQLYLHELKALYDGNVLFFNNDQGGSLIAGLWNPQTGPRPLKVNLPYTIKPIGRSGDEDIQINMNKTAILHDIATLGGGMLSRIELK